MSQQLINLSPDLKRLRDEGYDLEIRSNHLLVKSVPYLTTAKEIRFGTLVCTLTLAGNITTLPDDHQAYFIGEAPCDKDGIPNPKIINSSSNRDLGPGVAINHSFSAKPTSGRYNDYYEKISTYVAILSGPAEALDRSVTAKVFRITESGEDESPFKYMDTASSRAGVGTAMRKLGLNSVGIIGLGGTGSYILDLIAKTPVKEVHLFDGDTFLQHNAFRSPGAPSLEELREKPTKVAYFERIYSRMRRGIIGHPEYVEGVTLEKLVGLEFVFLCLDSGPAKKVIVERLEGLKVPFIDVGMGLQTGSDVADIAALRNGNAITLKELSLSQETLNRISLGDAEFHVDRQRGRLFLVSYQPLRLFRDVVGVLILGYDLNGRLAQDISKATNTTGVFVEKSGNAAVVEIPISRNQRAYLSVKSSFAASLSNETVRPIFLAGFVGLLFLVSLLYLVLSRGFVRGFGLVLEEIDQAAKALDRNTILVPLPKRFPILEVTKLSSAFSKFAESTKQFHERLEQKTRVEAMGEKAAQLAHDLKGPVQALSMALDIEELKEITPAKKEAIQAMLARIQGIAATVKEGNEPEKSFAQPNVPVGESIELLSNLVESIAAEKSIQYSDRNDVTILVQPPADMRAIYVDSYGGELHRILSNLIDNAVDAIQDGGSVTLHFFEKDEAPCIEVIDSGRGIPSHVLGRIGERGFSYEKEAGSGLGVWHAKTQILSWGGAFNLDSKEEHGTTISLELPKPTLPKRFLTELDARNISHVVVLDDDESVHFLWTERFKTLAPKIPVVAFESAEALVLWWVKNRKTIKEPLFLSDYDLRGQSWTGLHVIEELEQTERSVLVTGHWSDPKVIAQCRKLGVRLLPKETISGVRITVDERVKARKV